LKSSVVECRKLERCIAPEREHFTSSFCGAVGGFFLPGGSAEAKAAPEQSGGVLGAIGGMGAKVFDGSGAALGKLSQLVFRRPDRGLRGDAGSKNNTTE
jgi:hypothetical protein